MSHIDNIIIQVRARLQAKSIKLWLEPYYFPDIGSVEAEIDILAQDFSHDLGISISNCKLALTELQEGALRKLAARKEYEETGLATFSVRRISNEMGTENVFEVKCSLTALGSELQKFIAQKLNLNDTNRVKCISAGKMVDPGTTLLAQGLKNNQQLMVIISCVDSNGSHSNEAMYDRIRKIKMDVEKIVDSKRQLFEMEDQDGNPVFLPPNENRALLIAMGLCEKARSAMKRQHYDEALVLLLEADERFTMCNSKFLESVDNYALVNLDIVWCYLCLKNVTQLPDAQRRLEICEKSFRRSYGDNMERLIALKGKSCPERALLLRLHLLQGVVFFHQNQRNQAYEKLETATNELRSLKVNDASVESLVEMGFEPYEARLGLRATDGNIEQAINFIQDRKDQIRDARKRSKKERHINADLIHDNKNDKDWVNPRSVCTLMEMGFSRDKVIAALKQSKNNITEALDLLQNKYDELNTKNSPSVSSDNVLVEELTALGFDDELARAALNISKNNMEKAIDFLVKSFGNMDQLQSAMQRFAEQLNASNGPSTSSGTSSLLDRVMQKAKAEMESMEAYSRFQEDISGNEQEYLDLPLIQEEQILAEYKNMLEQ